MDASAREYTWHVITAQYPAGPCTFYAWTDAERDRLIAKLRSSSYAPPVEEGEPGRLTLRVGQRVVVSAYGRPRQGEVKRLGPRRVLVTFERNAARQLATRPFGAWEITPGRE
jgi:hypothetical protein